jgi:hypothetical protein
MVSTYQSNVEFVVEVRQPGKEAVTYRCGAHSLAVSLAKKLNQSGTKAIVRRKRSSEPRLYSILVVDLDTGEMVETAFQYQKLEAITFWRHWKIDSTDAVVLMWPSWRPIPPRLLESIAS